jgi:peptidyl-prolyl cis-trans isomerase SurA
MTSKFINRTLIILVILTFGSTSMKAQDGGSLLVDKIICKVDNYIILKSELERAYLEFLSRGQYTPGDVKCEILESLIVEKVLVAKAEIDSVVVSDLEVEGTLQNRINYILSQVGGSEESIIEAYGKSLEEIKEELRDDIKNQLVSQRMRSTVTEGIKVSPSEVKKFFNRIAKEELPYYSTEVTLGQIVKIPTVNKTEKQKIIDQLNELRAKILKEEVTFGDMAREYSQDPGSRANGGEYPFIKRGEFAPEYEAAAFTLKPGEISKPIETDFGLHIVQLLERRGNEFRSRHILIQPQFTESDFLEAEHYLDSLKNLVEKDSISFEFLAKEYSDDQITSSSGGFMLDPNGVNRISVEDLEPSMFFTIDTMTVGTISKPMRYRNEQGKDVVRILFYKNKVKPHQANLSEDYQKIYAATLQSKRSNIMNEWYEGAKDEVFINLDKEYNYCNILE